MREPLPPVMKASRVLVVDDEPGLLRVLQRYLTRLGYDVVTASSAEEALEAFRQSPASFSAIVTDLALPRMSGEELLRRVFELHPSARALICSGNPADLSMFPDHVRGRIGFLQKPFPPRMLADAMKKLEQEPEPAGGA